MTGTTPLALAVESRHWTTARLILAIAAAQYKPSEKQAAKFTVKDIALGKMAPIYLWD